MRFMSAVLLVCVSGMLAGCEAEPARAAQDPSGQRPVLTEEARAEKAEAVPHDFTFEVVTSGGVTGAAEGFRVEHDGGIYRYAMAVGAKRDEERTGTLPAATVAELYRLLQAAHFFELPEGAPANLTTSVSVNAHGRRHSVAFEAGAPPEALKALLALAPEAVRAFPRTEPPTR